VKRPVGLLDMNVIPRGFFKDAVNPTDDEIIRWAYIDGTHYPPEIEQDWDLYIAEPERADIFIRLASDRKCPNRKFFLSCLYLLIGDAIRSNGQTWPIPKASAWIAKQTLDLPDDVNLFLNRSKELINNPQNFDYGKWCDGGHAYEY